MFKLLNRGYSNVMLAYWVEYSDETGSTITYFDKIKEANDFITERKEKKS
jgi:hypothetical protein